MLPKVKKYTEYGHTDATRTYLFQCRKLGCRSWVIPLAPTCVSPFNGGICQQNMYLNMYTTISKLQESPTCKDSNAKCFIMTNLTAKLSPGVVNRGEL